MTEEIIAKRVEEDPSANIKIEIYDRFTSENDLKIKEFRKNVIGIMGRAKTPEEEAEHADKYSSEKDAKKWIFAFDGENLVGMAEAYGRVINFENVEIALGGIGRLRVKENWRKKGIATKMINKTMGELQRLNYDAVQLSTEIDSFLGAFFNKYGFVPLNKPYLFTGLSGKQYVHNDGMIAPVRSQEKFQKILNGKESLNIGKGNW